MNKQSQSYFQKFDVGHSALSALALNQSLAMTFQSPSSRSLLLSRDASRWNKVPHQIQTYPLETLSKMGRVAGFPGFWLAVPLFLKQFLSTPSRIDSGDGGEWRLW